MDDEKKKFGQFFTPPTIAEFMVNLALFDEANTFLDPAVGEGVFTSIAKSKKETLSITACEIDKNMVDIFKSKNDYDVDLIQNDYLYMEFPKKFDCIVCNPPYNKFQEIENRQLLRKKFKNDYNISMLGYSNICVYFIIKSMNELKKNGRCCFIVPYEFLNTGYGTEIKKYILSSRMLKSIIRFDNKLNLFDRAITTSCIILLENCNHDKVRFVNINSIEELTAQKVTNEKTYRYDELNPTEKWLNYFDFESGKNSFSNIISLSSIGKVSRGIATGNNNFFSLNQSSVKKFNLSNQTLLPCFSKSPDVTDLVITDEVFNKMKNLDKKVFLFDGEKAISKDDFEYINYGKSIGVDKSYLTSHRKPWFRLEDKPPSPILISVFNRGKIKIIRNEIKARNLTSFHGLSPYDNTTSFANLLFCYFLTPISQELLFKNKREYGDGLDKFEPNDLNNGKMLNLSLLSANDIDIVLSFYEELRKTQKNNFMKELNDIFLKIS